MPVYLFTYHAYRSWRPDNKRGFVQTHRGIQQPNPALARAYDRAAKQPVASFGKQHREAMLWILHDACTNRHWRLHAVAFEPTHVHALVSWRGAGDWRGVSTRLKNLGSLTLGRVLSQPGRRWFVAGDSRKRVRDTKHFEYLMNEYLPRHHFVWREGDAKPNKPKRVDRTAHKKPSASAEGYYDV